MKPPWDGGNLVVTRLMGVLKASVPLFIDVTGKKLVEEDRVGNVGVSAPTDDRQTQAAPVLESGIAT